MHTTHITDPIPVFPTAGAQPWTTRTPMGQAMEAATTKAIYLIGDHTHLSDAQIADLVTARVGDYLDDYARTLEEYAMEALVEDRAKGCGIIAIWHGADYSIAFTPDVPAGHLVERRCFCGRRPTELN